MKKITFLLMFFFLLAVTLAQTPQYYTSNTGTSSNSFPFNVTSGKAVNSLILPGEIILPNPAPAGNIVKVYFRTSSTGTRTFNNLHVLFAQDSTITTLTTGQFYPGPWDTVYYEASTTLSSTTGGWMGITLEHPYAYNPAKPLIIFVGQCGYTGTGTSVYNTTGLSGIRRTWSVGGCPFTPYASGDASLVNFGVDIVIPPPATPQYYNYNTTVGANSFPFNVSTGKMVQWLVGPGEFNQPSPAVSGNISAVYFYMAGTATGRSFTNLTIRMGRTSITTLPTGQFYSGQLDTVYHKDTVVLSSTSATWMVIPLDVPFMYYNDSSLVIEVGQCGYTPTAGTMTVNQTTITGFMRRSWSVGGCPFVYTSQGAQIANSGIYIPVPVAVNNNNNETPLAYRLEQNYPNPFNPVTQISYSVPKAGIVKLIVYDILGREVTALVNGFVTAGNHTVNFDASNLSSGVYIYKIQAGNFSDSKKLVLMK